jgi:hypothetical protein
MTEGPESVIPAPHRVRDKLQRESRTENSKKELLDARLRDCVVMSFRGESREIFELQVLIGYRFLASLEMTNSALIAIMTQPPSRA